METGEKTANPVVDPDAASRAELRTIGFRLREIQRLLSMRVMQENVRLEAEGLEPVSEARFFKETTDEPSLARGQVAAQAAQLGELELGATVQLTLLNGTTIAGIAGPIDYVPDERLRLELRPRDDSSIRYEAKALCDDAGWSPVTVRRYARGDDDWEVLGVVKGVQSSALALTF